MKKSGIDVDFLSNKFMQITYQIATALSGEMNMTLSQVLIAFDGGGTYYI
jgi:hypothetical protein